jgi:hypothetical protein
MLTIISKQQSQNIESYFDPNVLTTKESTMGVESFIVTDRIIVKANTSPILTYDNTYIEPFTYVDGVFYDANGTPVDALYYNTISWDVIWNGGYP